MYCSVIKSHLIFKDRVVNVLHLNDLFRIRIPEICPVPEIRIVSVVRKIRAAHEVIREIVGHLPRTAQIEVVSAVVGIRLPVHIDLIPVIIGVQVIDTDLLSEVGKAVVNRNGMITHRGRRAVENECNAVAAAQLYGFLQNSYIVFVYPVALSAVPVVVFASCVTVMAVIYQKTLEVVSYAAGLPVFEPDIMKTQEGKIGLKAF